MTDIDIRSIRVMNVKISLINDSFKNRFIYSEHFYNTLYRRNKYKLHPLPIKPKDTSKINILNFFSLYYYTLLIVSVSAIIFYLSITF